MKQLFLVRNGQGRNDSFFSGVGGNKKAAICGSLLITQKRIFFWLTEGKISEYDDWADNLG